ncbi:hypothetical protein E4T56_gene7250 [Termitomyces sp. T112]|nr:hypothetical protein E4T56_gene7250 [Termitomyces sp. T112]
MEAVTIGDIEEAGPLTSKHVAGGIAKGLATTLKGKGKGKGKAREEKEEEKYFEELIKDLFTDQHLATQLCWQKASIVVDTGMEAGQQGACEGGLSLTGPGVAEGVGKKGEPIQVKHSSLHLSTLQDRIEVGGSSVAKSRQQEKSFEVVESEDKGSNRDDNDGSNNSNDVPLACKQSASPASVASAKQPRTVTSKEREGELVNMEMREKTPLVTITEVKPAIDGGEVEGGQEIKKEVMEVEKAEESEEEVI